MNYKEICEKYSGAKEVYALMRNKKMSVKEHIFDALVFMLTPLPGIVEEADMLSDLGSYYLVTGEHENKLVRVQGKDLTEQVITVDCSGRNFVVDGNRFRKVRKLNGKKL